MSGPNLLRRWAAHRVARHRAHRLERVLPVSGDDAGDRDVGVETGDLAAELATARALADELESPAAPHEPLVTMRAALAARRVGDDLRHAPLALPVRLVSATFLAALVGVTVLITSVTGGPGPPGADEGVTVVAADGFLRLAARNMTAAHEALARGDARGLESAARAAGEAAERAESTARMLPPDDPERSQLVAAARHLRRRAEEMSSRAAAVAARPPPGGDEVTDDTTASPPTPTTGRPPTTRVVGTTTSVPPTTTAVPSTTAGPPVARGFRKPDKP
jgi:hypothetical protein